MPPATPIRNVCCPLRPPHAVRHPARHRGAGPRGSRMTRPRAPGVREERVLFCMGEATILRRCHFLCAIKELAYTAGGVHIRSVAHLRSVVHFRLDAMMNYSRIRWKVNVLKSTKLTIKLLVFSCALFITMLLRFNYYFLIRRSEDGLAV